MSEESKCQHCGSEVRWSSRPADASYGAMVHSGNMTACPVKAVCATNPIDEMFGWITDCQWADMERDDLDELSMRDIVNCVARHYDGGVNGFLADSVATNGFMADQAVAL